MAPAAGRAARCKAQRAAPESARVDQHVAGVGQQGQRVRSHSDQHLDDHERHDEDQGCRQPAPVGGSRDPVLVVPTSRVSWWRSSPTPRQVSEACPQPVMQSVPGQPPRRDKMASMRPPRPDPVAALARSGLMALTGWPDGAPRLPPVGITRRPAGAAHQRDRTAYPGPRPAGPGELGGGYLGPGGVARPQPAGADRRRTDPAGCWPPAMAGWASAWLGRTTPSCCRP